MDVRSEGDGKNPKEGRTGWKRSRISPELAVFALGTLLFNVFYLISMAPGLVFGKWQGYYLQPSTDHHLPLIFQKLSIVARYFTGNDVVALNMLTGFSGALSCATLGALATHFFMRLFPPLLAMAGGVLASGLLACLPPVFYVSTGCSPAPLTLLLALAGIACLAPVVSAPERHGMPWIIAAGLFAGLGAANNPAFGVLALILLFVLVLLPPGRSRSPMRVIVFACSFGVTAALPWINSVLVGETLPEFLFHALRTPYPAVWNRLPDLRFASTLEKSVPLPMALLALAGLLPLFRRAHAWPMFLLIAIFMCMGPLLPSLTNQDLRAHPVVDLEASMLLVLACLCLFMAQGILLIAFFVTRKRAGFALLLGLALGIPALWLQWPTLPRNDSDQAQAIARSLLENCPPDSLLVSGDVRISSLLLACQASSDLRKDVAIVPVESLLSRRGRDTLATRFGPRLTVKNPFPDSDSAARWQHELPVQFSVLAKNAHFPESESLEAFALWDFVRDNFYESDIAFVGLSPGWLTARAQNSGFLLFYPARAVAGAAPTLPLRGPESQAPDPEEMRTLSALLLPISHAARKQARAGLAERLAGMARDYNPEDTESTFAYLAAQARQGRRKEVLAQAENYFEGRQADAAGDQRLQAIILDDLERQENEKTLLAFLSQEKDSWGAPDARKVAFNPLWTQEELTLLAFGYESILEEFPSDIDALYQLAALRAQFGEWEAAGELLARWVLAGQYPPEQVVEKLWEDGRFAQFHVYRRASLPTSPHSS